MKPLSAGSIAGVALALVLGALACRAATPAATPTAVPSDTPTPTRTPSPTSTETPRPTVTFTATPNAAATLSARFTQEAAKESADLQGELDSLGISTDTGSLGWYQLIPETIEINDYNTWSWIPLAEDLSASDFVLSSDITWDTDGLLTCGLIFRSENNIGRGDKYIFEFLRLSGLPAWMIEYAEGNEIKNSPTDIKFSSALDLTNGARNNIVLVAEGDKFTLYINQVRQGSFFDYSEQRTDGRFAFYGWQESGNSTCKFENTSVWVYK